MNDELIIKPFGDRAALIEFGQQISLPVHEKIMKLSQAIEKSNLEAISFFIPAYCSLTIGYHPEIMGFDALKIQILKWSKAEVQSRSKQEVKKWRIPVCYEAPFSPDLEEVTAQTNLSAHEIIDSHCQTLFRVFMLGFIPGFTYMGRLPEALFCKRKESPRKKVDACSVGLAGHQTGIYPSDAPGGWQIIGRTPLKPFDNQRQKPFLFKAGDQVSFYSISSEEYEVIRREVDNGLFKEADYAE